MRINKSPCDSGVFLDKLLYGVSTPTFLPGPFANRLKWTMKQEFFEKKTGYSMHLVYSTAIVCLCVLCGTLIWNPQTAQRLNTFVNGNSENTTESLLLAEREIDLAGYPASIKTVSTEVNSTFPFIEEDKQYIVSKFRNHENKELIYISEVKRPEQPRRSY